MGISRPAISCGLTSGSVGEPFLQTLQVLSRLLGTSEHLLAILAVFVFRIYSTNETDIKKKKSTCKRKRKHIIYNVLFFICCD